MWKESQKNVKKCLRIFLKEKVPFESQENGSSGDVKMMCRTWLSRVGEKQGQRRLEINHEGCHGPARTVKPVQKRPAMYLHTSYRDDILQSNDTPYEAKYHIKFFYFVILYSEQQCAIISQIITLLLHVSTLLCHPE